MLIRFTNPPNSYVFLQYIIFFRNIVIQTINSVLKNINESINSSNINYC